LKRILAVILVVCMLGLTGCVRMVEITDEESETIARTAAWLLFKYDNNYTENLVTPVLTMTPTPVPTATPTPVPDEQESTNAPVQETTKTEQDDTVSLPEFNSSFEEVIGTEKIRFTYEGYELYDSYTFDSFSVEPKTPGNCLMLVFLQLQNMSTESARVNVLELQPKCRLYADVTKQMVPKRTVLLNDFQYLVAEIPTGESYNSVLVFEVEKDFSPEKLDLFLTVGENTAHMSLQ